MEVLSTMPKDLRGPHIKMCMNGYTAFVRSSMQKMFDLCTVKSRKLSIKARSNLHPVFVSFAGKIVHVSMN